MQAHTSWACHAHDLVALSSLCSGRTANSPRRHAHGLLVEAMLEEDLRRLPETGTGEEYVSNTELVHV